MNSTFWGWKTLEKAEKWLTPKINLDLMETNFVIINHWHTMLRSSLSHPVLRFLTQIGAKVRCGSDFTA